MNITVSFNSVNAAGRPFCDSDMWVHHSQVPNPINDPVSLDQFYGPGNAPADLSDEWHLVGVGLAARSAPEDGRIGRLPPKMPDGFLLISEEEANQLNSGG